MERNGPIESYRVVYYPISDPSDRSARTIAGTGDRDRMFPVTGLPPRTSYTFEVQASNTNLDVRGAAATFTVSTTAPQSESLTLFMYRIIACLNNNIILKRVCYNLYYFTGQHLVFSLMVSSILTTVL